MQLVLKNKYFLTSVLMSSEQQDVVLCRRMSADMTSFQKYIINIYKDRSVITDILPELQDLKNNGNDRYIEHFIDNSKLHLVFRHNVAGKRLILGKNLSLKDRMDIANNLFIEILKLNDLPAFLVYKLLNSNNILISPDKSVYFNHIFDLSDRERSVSPKDIVGRAGKVLMNLFADREKVPVQLSAFVSACCKQQYESLAQAYSSFKAVKSKFEEVEYNFRKHRKLFPMISFLSNTAQPRNTEGVKKLRRAVVYTLITCFLATSAALYIYHNYFRKATPATVVSDIYIPEPAKVKPTPTPEPVKETPAPQPAYIEYTVKKGDSLTRISKEFYGNANNYITIAEFNGIKNPNLISVGMVLKLPTEGMKQTE